MTIDLILNCVLAPLGLAIAFNIVATFYYDLGEEDALSKATIFYCKDRSEKGFNENQKREMEKNLDINREIRMELKKEHRKRITKHTAVLFVILTVINVLWGNALEYGKEEIDTESLDYNTGYEAGTDYGYESGRSDALSDVMNGVYDDIVIERMREIYSE